MSRRPVKEVARPQDLREGNIRHLFRLLTEKDSYTINELAREMGLSRTAVQNIMARMKKSGIITTAGKRSSNPQGGKRPSTFSLRAEYKYGIFIVVMTNEIMIELNDFLGKRVDTKRLNVFGVSYGETLERCGQAVAALLSEHRLTNDRLFGIAVTLSGTVDSSRGVVLNFTGTNDPVIWGANVPVVDDVRRVTGFRGVIVMDNLCAFSGYACYLSIPPEKRGDTCLCIMAHRLGIGASFIRNGVIEKGAHGVLGELGHMQVDRHTKVVCRCGRTGCAEAMLYPEYIREKVRNDEYLRNVGIESVEEMMARANEGIVRAQEEVRNIGGMFAQIIYNTQLVLDPDCVIFHDAYSVDCPEFREGLREAVEKRSGGLFSVPVDLHIDTSVFSKAVRTGAAEYLRQCYIDHFQEEE
ncbi:MAG: ROK family transcriptional regulator [Lachnospiraceae bacterium]|nr:ROK family transcriptional regulator [Lachnospiraceae bacterium]